jgi:hypothetical protein
VADIPALPVEPPPEEQPTDAAEIVITLIAGTLDGAVPPADAGTSPNLR